MGPLTSCGDEFPTQAGFVGHWVSIRFRSLQDACFSLCFERLCASSELGTFVHIDYVIWIPLTLPMQMQTTLTERLPHEVPKEP